MMNFISRRRFLHSSLALSGGLIAAGAGFAGESATAASPDLVVAHGTDPKQIVRAAVERFGGLGKFISKGDVVVVKPNIGWNRLPEQAANTNPDVVAAIVEMALDAGAKEVKVFDRPVSKAQIAYMRCGIETAAKQAGAKVSHMDPNRFRNVAFKDTEFIKEWPIYQDVLECDCLINVPIAKHHNSSTLTLGLKNNMGLIGGDRGHYHRNLDVSIAELGTAIKPTLTIVDAFRILTKNGPTGGSLSDVKEVGKCIVGVDPVAVDSYAATLFGKQPEEIGHIAHAAKLGLGTTNLAKLAIVNVEAV